FRAAVVGTGFIGPVHVEALRRAGIEVAAVIGSTPAKSREAAERMQIQSRHETLEDILADDSIDSVHLTTPNRFHYEQATAVLRAGKHVLCEKPLAMNSRQSSELVRLAAESGLAAGVAYNIRFYPLCHEAAERIQQGKLGELLHVTGSYQQDWLLYETDYNWRVLSRDGGELRAIADIGTHWLDLIQFISGQRIVSVCADLRTVHPVRQRPVGSTETFSGKGNSDSATESVEITTEDCGSVMLKFANQTNGCLFVSQTSAGHKNCLRFEIAGSSQSFSWNSEAPNQLWIGHRSQPNELLIRDPALLENSAAKISNYPGGHNEGFPDTFKQLFLSFYGYIKAGNFSARPPFPTFLDGHQEIRLCEAILQSHRTRRWTDVETINE
ncbi:MAG: Gfo/Idh/MocA family oxidoreductase, partial [Planctomycetaceae bacterium]|nr:Gfo/Idh/MocA family oxidoreductase [Planctomycetaceae bacterium]